jgi:uncharacterized protein YkwD
MQYTTQHTLQHSNLSPTSRAASRTTPHTASSTAPRTASRTVQLCSLSLLCLLAACGGGGGGDSSAPAGAGSTTAGAPAAGSPPAGSPPANSPPASSPPANSPAPAPTAQLDAASTCGIANFQQELLQRVNAARQTTTVCGAKSFAPVAALQWNDKLFAAAAAHSQDMIARNFFAHTNPSGQDPGARISAQGYSWSTYGENIAAGQVGLDAVMQAWLKSPGHCENIMGANFRDIGLACVKSGSSPYWTMVLAKSR